MSSNEAHFAILSLANAFSSLWHELKHKWVFYVRMIMRNPHVWSPTRHWHRADRIFHFLRLFSVGSCPKITHLAYSWRILSKLKPSCIKCKVLDISFVFPMKIPMKIVFFCQNPVDFSRDATSTEKKVTSWRLSVWSIGAPSFASSCVQVPHYKCVREVRLSEVWDEVE
jgi:hypothetical protein